MARNNTRTGNSTSFGSTIYQALGILRTRNQGAPSAMCDMRAVCAVQVAAAVGRREDAVHCGWNMAICTDVSISRLNPVGIECCVGGLIAAEMCRHFVQRCLGCRNPLLSFVALLFGRRDLQGSLLVFGAPSMSIPKTNPTELEVVVKIFFHPKSHEIST